MVRMDHQAHHALTSRVLLVRTVIEFPIYLYLLGLTLISLAGNKKKVYSPPKPKAFRHPLDNPVFKIKEDSSAFIAHIKNTIRPGKVYTAIKKENVGSVDNGASQPSGDTPVTGLDDDFTILKSNRHASPLEKPIQTAQAVTQSATIRQGLASGLRVIPAFKSNLPNLDPVATESKASAELDIQVMQKSLPKNAGAWGFHSELVEILTDATKYAEYLGALTEEGTSAITDFPSNHDTFDNDNVSNDGVADIRAVESKNDQEELQDWDGSWNPAPVDWENGRPFDDSFVPEFIRVWAQENPYGPSVTVDRDAKEFILGNHPISNGAFCAPIDQPESIPGKTDFPRFMCCELTPTQTLSIPRAKKRDFLKPLNTQQTSSTARLPKRLSARHLGEEPKSFATKRLSASILTAAQIHLLQKLICTSDLLN